ncbi:hypothetical protein GFV14_00314 [Candidatus Hartigia pinicola]|nr:hypothetical protein GFV14_00314 [Candidatus Hartigia pinicola]
MNMIPGENTVVPTQLLIIHITSSIPVNASVFCLYESKKVKNNTDMVFHNQPTNNDQTISYRLEDNKNTFTIDLKHLNQSVKTVVFTVTCNNNETISILKGLSIQVYTKHKILLNGTVETYSRQESALILGELYLRNNTWKFRFIAQGFNGGLKPLAEYFGVNLKNTLTSSSALLTASSESIQQSHNLNKVSLTKETPIISLTKKNSFKDIRINLNWHRNNKNYYSSNFLSSIFNIKNQGIDLDLGAFVELQNREKYVIQALGNTFGNFHQSPFVALQGDDRTGDTSDGEWIHINGLEWKNIKQILIYAFIYEGIPCWEKTDGVVTILIPDQRPIETKLTEGNDNLSMCAIGRLVNNHNTIKIERINQFFQGHKDMDNAFGWGFQWSAGSK